MRELIGKIILDRYRVDEFLGRGGMAEVYKVWDTHRNAWVAMKVLHEDLALDHAFLRRFRREAQTLERLQHPNIVRFYGLEQEDRLIFMLMDYVDGESLKPRIFDAHGPLPFEQVYSITRELAYALKYAHSEGYVHADVKPGNIMLDEKGHVMLSDFGIARMTDTATMTMIGAGTPAYMAPEQIRGEAPAIQTDIYALGIVLYEMLTGERPFNGELATISGTVGEKVRWEQLNLNVPSPMRLNKHISPAVEALLLRTLAKDKASRFQDVGEFLAEFAKVFHKVVVSPRGVDAEAVGGEDKNERDKSKTEEQVEVVHESLERASKKKPQIIKVEPKPKSRVSYFVVAGVAVLLLAFGSTMGRGEFLLSSKSTLTLTSTNTVSPTEVPSTPTPSLGVGSTMVSEKDGMTMVYVPAGEFSMGSGYGYSDEKPVHTVYLPTYWIDQTEVTNRMYAQCVDAGVCVEPVEKNSYSRNSYFGNDEFDDYPVIWVSWYDAIEYCSWAGRRLPTEAEWEKAAGWNDDFHASTAYPWGDKFLGSANYCDSNCAFDHRDDSYNDNYEDTAPAKSFETGKSFYGVYNMAGNVWEWTSSAYDDYPYDENDGRENMDSGSQRIVRGGSWYTPQKSLRTSMRLRIWPKESLEHLGFRCASFP